MAKHGLWIGPLMGLFAVILGAFGAHGIERILGEISADELESKLRVWQVADRYLMYHAIVTFVVGMMGQFNRHKVLVWIVGCFVVGSLIFSGALFTLALTGMTWLGMVAPVGGTIQIIGWALLVFAGYQATMPRKKKK